MYVLGRHDLTVNHESVDFGVPHPIPSDDDNEYHVSRNFTYLARIVRTIKKMSTVYIKLRRTKDWAVNPEFQQIEHNISAYFSELPADMIITYPADGSPPYLPSSFLGNLHSYYNLMQILYHRPVLSFLDPTAHEAQWKRRMLICYNAAKTLCRLQEALLKQYGLVDLQSMQRGFSFALYAGLSCVVIHLVCSNYFNDVSPRIFFPTSFLFVAHSHYRRLPLFLQIQTSTVMLVSIFNVI